MGPPGACGAPGSTWLGVQVVGSTVVFGVARVPRIGSPAPAIAEVRIYVIETDDLRLELKESTTADAHRIDATVSAPLTFALLVLKYVQLKARFGWRRSAS